MRPAVATVVTAALWEPELVAAARRSGRARIVARCAHPFAILAAAGRAEVVVAGSGTPWLTAGAVAAWHAAGARVVGVAEPGDRAAADRLARIGCDLVADGEPEALLALIARLGPGREGGPASRHVVVGPRGSPGCTEVALGLALAVGPPALLVEADRAAPSLGLRLGLPPERRCRPRPWGPLAVLTASPGVTVADLEAEVAGWAGPVVVDAGPEPGEARRWQPARTVLVAAATPVGLVRAAAFTARIADLDPELVLNRCHPDDVQAVEAVLGRPVLVLPDLEPGGWGSPPPAAMVAALRGSGIVSGRPSGSSRGSGGRPASRGVARTRPPGRPGRADA